MTYEAWDGTAPIRPRLDQVVDAELDVLWTKFVEASAALALVSSTKAVKCVKGHAESAIASGDDYDLPWDHADDSTQYDDGFNVSSSRLSPPVAGIADLLLNVTLQVAKLFTVKITCYDVDDEEKDSTTLSVLSGKTALLPWRTPVIVGDYFIATVTNDEGAADISITVDGSTFFAVTISPHVPTAGQLFEDGGGPS